MCTLPLYLEREGRWGGGGWGGAIHHYKELWFSVRKLRNASHKREVYENRHMDMHHYVCAFHQLTVETSHHVVCML